MAPDPPARRPIDRLSPTMRLIGALAGLVVGLLLVFVGARSCETALEGETPTVVTRTTPNPN